MVTYVRVYVNGEEFEVEYAGPHRERAYQNLDFYRHVQHWEDGKLVCTEVGGRDEPDEERIFD